MKQSALLRRITERAGLPGEPIPGVPLLELSGDDRILIENHICIQGYSDQEVLVSVSFGQLKITGQGLVLSCLKKEQLIICGCVHSISVLRKG